MDNLMPGINPGLNWPINSASEPCPDCDETGEDGTGNECTTCGGSGWVAWEPSYGDSYEPGEWEEG